MQANYYAANSSDSLADPYLLGDGLKSAHINLQPEHTSLFKFPLFYLQSLFPYHYTSFSVVNICLSITTVLLWVYLLRKLLGKTHTRLLALTLAAFIFGSIDLNLQFGFTAIRNIEFPIALWYIMALAKFFKPSFRPTRKHLLGLLAPSIVYSLLIASDSYFIYVTSLTILIFLVWRWIQGKKSDIQELVVIISLLSTTLVGYILPKVLELSGFISLHSSGAFAQTTVTYSKFFASLAAGFKQLLDLGGANIFGQPIKASHLGIFINFSILLIAISGAFIILRLTDRALRLHKSTQEGVLIDPVLSIIALSFLFTFVVYVGSSQIQFLSNGTAIEGTDRYITFMIFLAVPLFLWFVIHYCGDRRNLKFLLSMLIFLSILVSTPLVHTSYAQLKQVSLVKRSHYLQTVRVLEKEHVQVVLSGHWLGATTRFWSDNKIQFAPIIACNKPFLALSRPSWYVAAKSDRSALLIDYTGDDSGFWNGCSDAGLVKVYGQPEKKVTIPGAETIWIYAYDVRTKLDATVQTY